MDEDQVHLRKRKSFFALILIGFILCAFVILQAGFIIFIQKLPQSGINPVPQADGIVVLTGDAQRIAAAMELLSKGRAKRLLISGVHANTNLKALIRNYPGYGAYFKCCVELDHKALNTIGNAKETLIWATSYRLNSLIVVTSAYHMPRSLLELRHVMSQISLAPFPVMSRKVKSEPWLANPFTERLLFLEYMKYILAQIRLSLSVFFSGLTKF